MMGPFLTRFIPLFQEAAMLTLDPYGSETLNTIAATYACVDCPDAWWCNPPYLPPDDQLS